MTMSGSKRGLRAVHSAVRDRLSGIALADDYYHDAPAIVPRVIRPELGQLRPPYICLPLDDNGTCSVDGDVITETVHQPVLVILPENNGIDFEDCGAADACNWHDDILKALMPDDPREWNLGDSAVVDDVTVTSKNLQSEPLDGFPAFVLINLEISVRFTRENLGRQGRDQEDPQ